MNSWENRINILLQQREHFILALLNQHYAANHKENFIERSEILLKQHRMKLIIWWIERINI